MGDNETLLQNMVSDIVRIPPPASPPMDMNAGHSSYGPRYSLPNIRTGELIGLRQAGKAAAAELTSYVLHNDRAIRRAIAPDTLMAELLNTVLQSYRDDFLGPDWNANWSLIFTELQSRLSAKIAYRTFYIPCALNPFHAKAFNVGPVLFRTYQIS